MIASQRALTYERQLMTGRWVEVQAPRARRWRPSVALPRHHRRQGARSGAGASIGDHVDPHRQHGRRHRGLRQGQPAGRLELRFHRPDRRRPGAGAARHDAARDTGRAGEIRRVRPVRSGGRGRSAHRHLPWRPRPGQRAHATQRAHHRVAPQSDPGRRFGDDLHRRHQAPAGRAGPRGVERDAGAAHRRTHRGAGRERALPEHPARQRARHRLSLPQRPRLDHGVRERRLPGAARPRAAGPGRRIDDLQRADPSRRPRDGLAGRPARFRRRPPVRARIPRAPCRRIVPLGVGPRACDPRRRRAGSRRWRASSSTSPSARWPSASSPACATISPMPSRA